MKYLVLELKVSFFNLNIDVHQNLNKCFLRYHIMDCMSLHKNSKNGQYWANAAHFLYCNQAYGYLFVRRFLTEYNSANPNLNSTSFDPDLMNSLLKVFIQMHFIIYMVLIMF